VLEQALAGRDGRAHPGVLHMYIHLMEMSARPEDALLAGDLLRDPGPRRGPTCGTCRPTSTCCAANYRSVGGRQLGRDRGGREVPRAARRDELLHACTGRTTTTSRSTARCSSARSGPPWRRRASLPRRFPGDLLRVQDPPMADWLEGFVAMAAARAGSGFGRWAEILAAPVAADPDLYLVTTAMTQLCEGRRARGHRAGRAGKPGSRPRFAAAVARVPRTRTIFNNTCQDILAVAGPCWTARSSTGGANYDEAFRLLRRARRTRRRPPLRRTMGAGYSQPGTPMAPCCSSRALLPRRRRSTAPTSAWTTRWPGRASTPATSWSFARVPRMPDQAGQG